MSQRDMARVCVNLTSAGVEVKAEEISSPTKAIILRVLGDFANISFGVCAEALYQPLACNLENHNPSSAVPHSTANKLILCREALGLLSKGSAQFSLTDVFKADQKKFSQMIQQMLKYLYHSESVYDVVSEACVALDETAARVERERQDLDFERNELEVASQRVNTLTEARVPETLAEATQKRDAINQECQTASATYNELKQQVERASAEVMERTREMEQLEQRLTDMRAMIVENPDKAVEGLRQLRDEVALHREQVASTTRSLRETSEILQSLNDALERLKSTHKLATQTAGGHDELIQMDKSSAKRLAAQKRALLELESELQELQASVETRKRQLEKIQAEHQETGEALKALVKDEADRKEIRAKKEALKRPLVTEIGKTTTIIETLQRTIVTDKENAVREVREGHNEALKRWNDHLDEVKIFTEKCEQADEQLEERRTQLVALSEAIERIALETVPDAV